MKLIEKKKYHENGQLMCHYFLDKSGYRQGEYKEYHDNGRLKFHLFFKNNQRQGECKIYYYDNGQLADHYFYDNNKSMTIKEWRDLQMKKKLQGILKWN